eukprot:CAMPEP_0197323452 /NCGR_PEP_ID=MMETSP0891-20130614/70528_1 /TAXON_ID=44058 ORGANISM="Aureoumbra lagunensis, Strain CCMP1510" /NCGR_SAMPLE_ID=MMETSP0891 /ASSEMBLY_ACC=CAM_ASM_000534 /LENGTH=595 /DNA_ID=CAMNT_0042816101 /DNA_START=61 /DNA_END=1848 /DNA_ORIENTATION=+
MNVKIEDSQPLDFKISREKTALLMIDFQGDFVDEEKGFVAAMGGSVKDNQKALGPAQRVLMAARRAKITIVHTLEAHRTDLADLHESKDRRSRPSPDHKIIGQDNGNGRMLTRGSKCNGLCPEVAWKDGEIAIHKPGKGAFYGTELLARLQYLGITHLIFCGCTTECCVQTTMREANDRGFDCLIVHDATASCLERFHTETIGQITAFGAIIGCAACAESVIQAFEALEMIPSTPTLLNNNDNISLPIVDISSLMTLVHIPNGHKARSFVSPEILNTADEIGRACRTLGFFYIVGHEINSAPILSAAKALFALPQHEKIKLKPLGGGEAAGYEPSGAQVLDEGRLGQGIDGSQTKNQADLKESYIIGKSVPTQRMDENKDRLEGRWPNFVAGYDNINSFRSVLECYHDQCENLIARGLMRAIALHLGLAADTFDASTLNSMTKLRLLKYPPCDNQEYANGAPGCGSHVDWGALTLLAQDEVGGLQVNAKPGVWIDAPSIPNALLVNVGDLMHLWTRGRLRSAPHRVLKPKLTGVPRYSAALFFNCDHNALIDPRLLEPNQILDHSKFDFSTREKEGGCLTAEAYILQRVAGTYHK